MAARGRGAESAGRSGGESPLPGGTRNESEGDAAADGGAARPGGEEPAARGGAGETQQRRGGETDEARGVRRHRSISHDV